MGLSPFGSSRDETLVLLSGMLGDEMLWSAVVERLPRDISTLCLRTDTAASVREMADAVLAVVPRRFSLAGHSFGAIVALEVFRTAPERVTRLALMSASARPGSPDQHRAWAAMRRECHEGGFHRVVSELSDATLVPHRRSEELVNRGLSMAYSVGLNGFLNQLAAQTSRPDSRPSLAAIHVPTLVLIGTRDEVCPPALQWELAAGIPDSVSIELQNAGHMTPLEAPEAVADALKGWLMTDPNHPVRQ